MRIGVPKEIKALAVPHMPATLPVTASHALNHATLPFGLTLAAQGQHALHTDAALRNGLNVYRGKLTRAPVAQALGMRAVAPDELFTRSSRVS